MSLQELDIAEFPLRGVSLIEASAGTGKTWTITRLYARALLERQLSVQQILVVTFTDAATQELKGRIREFVSGLLDYIEGEKKGEEDYADIFSAYRGESQAAETLRNALIDMDEASIHTIHGFCQRALSAYPLDTGSLLQQELMEDEGELKLAVMKDFWRREVVRMPDDSLAWLLDIWKKPEDMIRAMEPLLDYPELLEEFQNQENTEEKHLLSLAQEYENHWNEELLVQLLTGPDEVKIVKKRVNRNTVEKCCDLVNQFLKGNMEVLEEDALKYVTCSHYEGRCIEENRHLVEQPLFEMFERIIEAYKRYSNAQKRDYLVSAATWVSQELQKRKESQMAVSFDDLIGRLHDTLAGGDHRLARRLREDYPLALVDEFQDTDQRQFEIFRSIQAHDEQCGLVMIGDPKQSIYGFRGGDVFTYHQARKAAARQHTLIRNYRSRASMVQAVNQLFGHGGNPFVFDKLMDFQPVEAAREELILEDPQGNEAFVVWREPCTEKEAAAGSMERHFAEYCAREIQRLLSQGEIRLNTAKDKELRRVQAGDMAVLVNTNAQARSVQQALSKRGISSALRSQESVFESDQAREMLRLLDAVIEPDPSRLAVVLAGDLFGWSAARIQGLQSDGPETIRQLERLRDYHDLWRSQGIMAMMGRLLSDQGSLPRLLAMPEGERSVTNWLQLIELLQQQGSRHANPAETLRWLQQQLQGHTDLKADSHQLQLESDRELVTILTIHKAKGLEFPLVFIPYAWRGKTNRSKLPDCYVTHDTEGNKRVHLFDDTFLEDWRKEQLAEQIRLFYVAVTRAVHRCYIGWCRANGSDKTALAHLLYRNESSQVDLSCPEASDFDAPWQRLNAQGALVRLQEPPEESGSGKTFSEEESSIPAARRLHRLLQRAWRMSSYSQIVSGSFDKDVERAEHEDPAAPETEYLETLPSTTNRNRFTFYKGAKAGNFLHELMEDQRLDRAADEVLIRDKLNAYGFDEEWISVLRSWYEDIRCCDLGGHRLSDLTPRQCVKEMEFLMACRQLDVRALNDFLHRHDYLQPKRQLSFDTINGYLQGFIDLIYEIEGRYHVLDYKSNYLGASRQDYGPESCRQAMYDHDYHLQYLIYTLALHRHLKNRLADYDYARHMGGVRYLFLRGLSADSGTQYGVFSDCPSLAVIEELDRMLEGRVE